MAFDASLRRQVLVRSGSKVAPGGLIEHLLGAEGLAASDDAVARDVDDRHGEPERMVWSRELRVIGEPTDERLRVRDPRTHVHTPEEGGTRDALAGLREERNARRRPPLPFRLATV